MRAETRGGDLHQATMCLRGTPPLVTCRAHFSTCCKAGSHNAQHALLAAAALHPHLSALPDPIYRPGPAFAETGSHAAQARGLQEARLENVLSALLAFSSTVVRARVLLAVWRARGGVLRHRMGKPRWSCTR